MNLENTATSLLEQIPSSEQSISQGQKQLLEKFGKIAFGGFGVVVVTAVAAMIYVILTKMVFSGTNIWSGLLLTAFIVFGMLAVAYIVLAESINEKPRGLVSAPDDKFVEAAQTGRLFEEPHFEPAVSVTENSTELLSIKNKTRVR